jgi:hypothetical protein
VTGCRHPLATGVREDTQLRLRLTSRLPLGGRQQCHLRARAKLSGRPVDLRGCWRKEGAIRRRTWAVASTDRPPDPPNQSSAHHAGGAHSGGSGGLTSAAGRHNRRSDQAYLTLHGPCELTDGLGRPRSSRMISSLDRALSVTPRQGSCREDDDGSQSVGGLTGSPDARRPGRARRASARRRRLQRGPGAELDSARPIPSSGRRSAPPGGAMAVIPVAGSAGDTPLTPAWAGIPAPSVGISRDGEVAPGGLLVSSSSARRSGPLTRKSRRRRSVRGR